MRIKEFQSLVKDLYYHRDIKRGNEKNMLWLVEEVGELSQAMRKNDKDAIGEEMADIVAWVMSIANIYDMDMEEFISKKYPGMCAYCKSNPCSCEA